MDVVFQALVAEQESKDSGGASIAEQVLSIMEIILDEANAETVSEDKVSNTFGLNITTKFKVKNSCFQISAPLSFSSRVTCC